jgi:hypothetical protein
MLSFEARKCNPGIKAQSVCGTVEREKMFLHAPCNAA